MISRLVIAALLTITDPSPAPAASEMLVAPTSAMYRSLAPFALREISLLDSEFFELRIRLGSYANPLGLENGFSHPVIEVYAGGGEFGRAELLPGSGMRLPDGETWSVALHLTGDTALGFVATADGVREFTPELSLDGEYLYVRTDLPTVEDPGIAALTGLYSPFHADGWRPLGSSPGPWAFYAENQALPVVDVLALEEEVQKAALESGILPVTAFSTVTDPDTVWFVLMAAGVALAGAGLILRAFSRSAEPLPADPEDDVQVEDVSAAAAHSKGDAAEADEAEAETGEAAETEEAEEPAAVRDEATAAAAPVALVAAASLDEDSGESPAGQIFADADEPDADEPGAGGPPAPAAGADADGAGETDDETDEPLPEFAGVDFGEFGSWLGELGSGGDDDAGAGEETAEDSEDNIGERDDRPDGTGSGSS